MDVQPTRYELDGEVCSKEDFYIEVYTMSAIMGQIFTKVEYKEGVVITIADPEDVEKYTANEEVK